MTYRNLAVVPLVGLLGLVPASALAEAREFTAPAGQLGAGLSTDPGQRSRLFLDLGYFIQSGFATAHSLSTVLGFGHKLTDQLELDGQLPLGGILVSGAGGTSDRFAVGNLTLGLHYFDAKDGFLWKVGGGLAYGPWLHEAAPEDSFVLGISSMVRSYDALWHWSAPYLHAFVPARIEIGDELRFTGDAALNLAIPTRTGDVELIVALAPGVSYRPIPEFTFGARLPVNLLPTVNGDQAQLTLEPFVRADVNNAFLAARFLLNLDDALGFSFDQGRVWGLHAAVGASF